MMNIIEKTILLDKLIQKKEGILLDYISFNKGISIDENNLYLKRKESLNNNSNIGIKFYLHLPFCATLCKYCMYSSIKYNSREEIDEYIDIVINYLQRYKDLFKEKVFNGIYVGGGTPSLLNISQFNKLFSYIFSNFKFDDRYYKEIELNPSSTSNNKLDLLYKFGFNRISFGVQSFNKETLKKENRKYIDEKIIKNLVEYSKKIGFKNINLDMIVGLNDEKTENILNTFKKLEDIKSYSITVYTILKDMEKSVLFKESPEKFYNNIDNIYSEIFKETNLLKFYNKQEWSNILGFSLKLKNHKFDKLLYDAHNENIESLFGVGYKSFGKIWGVGTYDTLDFGKSYKFSFIKNDFMGEFYSAFLQSFQFIIDKKLFLDNFGIDVSSHFRSELDYLLSKKLVKEDEKEIVYIGNKNLIGYYGLYFLDLKNLIKFIRSRFYEKK